MNEEAHDFEERLGELDMASVHLNHAIALMDKWKDYHHYQRLAGMYGGIQMIRASMRRRGTPRTKRKLEHAGQHQ